PGWGSLGRGVPARPLPAAAPGPGRLGFVRRPAASVAGLRHPRGSQPGPQLACSAGRTWLTRNRGRMAGENTLQAWAEAVCAEFRLHPAAAGVRTALTSRAT